MKIKITFSPSADAFEVEGADKPHEQKFVEDLLARWFDVTKVRQSDIDKLTARVGAANTALQNAVAANTPT